MGWFENTPLNFALSLDNGAPPLQLALLLQFVSLPPVQTRSAATPKLWRQNHSNPLTNNGRICHPQRGAKYGMPDWGAAPMPDRSEIGRKTPCADRSQSRYCPPRFERQPDPIVQWPRTPPFHGGNTGSNPVRVAFSISKRDSRNKYLTFGFGRHDVSVITIAKGGQDAVFDRRRSPTIRRAVTPRPSAQVSAVSAVSAAESAGGYQRPRPKPGRP